MSCSKLFRLGDITRTRMLAFAISFEALTRNQSSALEVAVYGECSEPVSFNLVL
jgi:hypothetical protein